NALCSRTKNPASQIPPPWTPHPQLPPAQRRAPCSRKCPTQNRRPPRPPCNFAARKAAEAYHTEGYSFRRGVWNPKTIPVAGFQSPVDLSQLIGEPDFANLVQVVRVIRR